MYIYQKTQNLYKNIGPNDESLVSFYLGIQQKTIVTAPLGFLVTTNVIFHTGMLIFFQVDLILNSFTVWLLGGQAIALVIATLTMLTAALPLIVIPTVWHSQLSISLKIVLFILIPGLLGLAGNLMSTAFVLLLNEFSALEATLWWAELWGRM